MSASSKTSPALREFAQWVHRTSGIVLRPEKRALVEARLRRFRDEGGFDSLESYLSHLLTRATPKEKKAVLDAITTNTTSFYREAHHFQLLGKKVVPSLRKAHETFRAWSAACSTGEEPYTIALELEYLKKMGELGDYRVLATDISLEALRSARQGLYPKEKLRDVAQDRMKLAFNEVVSPDKRTMQVKSLLREKVSFHQLNLISGPWNLKPKFEVIFCRNVLIYFDEAARKQVVEPLVKQLVPSGYLILGHSDNAVTKGLQIEPIGPTAYRKFGDETSKRGAA